jgi:hypothetical protein
VNAIFDTDGDVSDGPLEPSRAAGHEDAVLLEVIGGFAGVTYNNSLDHLKRIGIGFPAVATV